MADPVLSWGGLLAFAAYVATAAGVLLFDLRLWLTGRRTITRWATAKTWRWVAIAAASLVGPLGLVAHFVWFPR
jgi:hypothetical protein